MIFYSIIQIDLILNENCKVWYDQRCNIGTLITPFNILFEDGMIHCAAPRRCTAQAGTQQISKSGAGIRASLQSTSVINLSSRQEINNIPNMRAALLDDAPCPHQHIYLIWRHYSRQECFCFSQYFEVYENLTKYGLLMAKGRLNPRFIVIKLWIIIATASRSAAAAAHVFCASQWGHCDSSGQSFLFQSKY